MAAAPKSYILVDQSKFVDELGQNFRIPVEVLPMALSLVESKLVEIGAEQLELRPATGKDGPIITESGSLILDIKFREVHSSLEKEIKGIPGVIESGLFQAYPIEVLSA